MPTDGCGIRREYLLLMCTIAVCREFAANVGMSFKTPQEAFGEKNSGGTGANAKLVAVFNELADKYKGTENSGPSEKQRLARVSVHTCVHGQRRQSSTVLSSSSRLNACRHIQYALLVGWYTTLFFGNAVSAEHCLDTAC